MATFRGIDLDGLVLRTDRLELRPWRVGDAERVREVLAGDELHRLLALPRPYTIEHARAYVTGGDGRPDGSALGCAVTERSGGRLVGSCVLRLGRHPEIGYWVAADAQGHGYAAEATRALAEWGFAAGMRRIGVVCSTANVASARTALAAGFSFEGISRDGYLAEPAPGGDHCAAPDGDLGAEERRGDVARFARLASDTGRAVPLSMRPLPRTGLSDGVLALRVCAADDATALRECDDEEALRWSFSGEAMPLQHAQRSAADAGLLWLVGRTGLLLSMVDVGTGAFAGGLTLRLGGPPGVCALGYAVHPGFRGRGYTTRALRLLAGWAFEHTPIVRFELGARTGNVASQRAAMNAGFRREGTFAARLRGADGTFHDEARFVLLSPRLPGRG